MSVLHFVYPLICWWTVGCFHLLTVMNDAAMNTGVKIYVPGPAFTLFGYVSRSRVAGVV